MSTDRWQRITAERTNCNRKRMSLAPASTWSPAMAPQGWETEES